MSIPVSTTPSCQPVPERALMYSQFARVASLTRADLTRAAPPCYVLAQLRRPAGRDMQQGRAAASARRGDRTANPGDHPTPAAAQNVIDSSFVVHCTGRVYDAAAVGRVTRRHNVPYLLDACQSVGQVLLGIAASSFVALE